MFACSPYYLNWHTLDVGIVVTDWDCDIYIYTGRRIYFCLGLVVCLSAAKLTQTVMDGFLQRNAIQREVQRAIWKHYLFVYISHHHMALGSVLRCTNRQSQQTDQHWKMFSDVIGFYYRATACNATQDIAVRILSICLSVRPSVHLTRVLWQN